MKKIFFVVVALLLAASANAKVKLPSILGNNMVLQRNAQVNLWGEAKPNGRVTVLTSWNEESYKTTADASGKWKLQVTTTDAGGPYTLTFSDGETTQLTNIMLGEVWICSGQSNMEMPVCGFMYQPVEGSTDAIVESAMYPDIRLFTVPKVSSPKPVQNCDAVWQVGTPEAVGAFSATGYFFGRTLHKVLGVPIGLISPNWGGSTIEAWMSEEAIDSTPGIDLELAKSGTYDNSIPARLFNGMILPICNFTAKGFIWYQGESNRKNWFDYKALQVSLVELWRNCWGNDDMPFYYVQLAPHNYEGKDLRSLALVIEAQYQAMAEIPHSGIAATTDIGSSLCIHPQKKREVGARLAYLALSNDYDIVGMPAPAPTFKSMERDGNKMIISFNNLSIPGNWNDANSLNGYLDKDNYLYPAGFEIAGEDRVFYPAKGNIRYWENRIEVSSDKVSEPVAVRYAFKNYCSEANVSTTMGQPLAPFRTDDWPLDDIGEIR